MSFSRLLQTADDLVGALGLKGPRPADVIQELDALRFVVKSLRELRHGIALGGQVDDGALDAITERMAEHLGVDAKSSVAIRMALEEESETFAREFIKGMEALGRHGHFHEDHGVLDSRTFPEEANNSPPPSERVLRSTFEQHRKARHK
jgi:hypothetical protein